MIRAFSRVVSTHRDARLVIAGPDHGQEKKLRREVFEMKLNEYVTFTGYLDQRQKLSALADSDLLVVPSRSEVFAISAVEGLLCGTPVLMSSACGLYPLPTPAQGLVQFHSENVQDLAQKLLTMIGQEDFRHNVAEGKRLVTEEFSSEAIARRAEAIYSTVRNRA